jgi:anaerobic magnesium-protoporphyrin IX monomethyl ester cyclase
MPDSSDQRELLAKHAPTLALVRVLGLDRHDFNHADYCVGLGYLAAVARQESATVALFDPIEESEISRLMRRKWDIVGFTVNHLNILETLRAAQVVKMLSPTTITIVGGHHASATASDIIADCPQIDLVCEGEGEQFIRTFINEVRRLEPLQGVTCSQIRRGQPVHKLDALPLPSHECAGEIARISTSRGCPYACSFCTTPGIRLLLSEPPYRFRSAESVVDEIETLYIDRDVRIFYINDDLFAFNSAASRERARKIAALINRRGLTICYKVQIRVDSFSPEQSGLLAELRASGLKEVFMGIESGSDAILVEYNKLTNTSLSATALQMMDRARIHVNAGNILASPDSTLAQIQESIEGFRQMSLAYLFFRRVTFRAHVFPGTALEARLQAEGRLEAKPRYLERKYSFSDKRVEDVTNLFEQQMPRFLAATGARVFTLRKRLLELCYDSHVSKVDVLPLLEAWNERSAQFLTDWFIRRSANQITQNAVESDFDSFIDYCTGLATAMDALAKRSSVVAQEQNLV